MQVTIEYEGRELDVTLDDDGNLTSAKAGGVEVADWFDAITFKMVEKQACDTVREYFGD